VTVFGFVFSEARDWGDARRREGRTVQSATVGLGSRTGDPHSCQRETAAVPYRRCSGGLVPTRGVETNWKRLLGPVFRPLAARLRRPLTQTSTCVSGAEVLLGTIGGPRTWPHLPCRQYSAGRALIIPVKSGPGKPTARSPARRPSLGPCRHRSLMSVNLRWNGSRAGPPATDSSVLPSPAGGLG